MEIQVFAGGPAEDQTQVEWEQEKEEGHVFIDFVYLF